MMKREELLKITSYEECDKRRSEFKGMKMDRELLEYVSKLFPKGTSTKEELYKTPPSKGGTIGR